MKIVIFSKIAENKRVFDDFWVFLWVFCVFLEFFLFIMFAQFFLSKRKKTDKSFFIKNQKKQVKNKRFCLKKPCFFAFFRKMQFSLSEEIRGDFRYAPR